MKENMTFDLSEKLEISKGGEFVETASIDIEPPCMKTNREVSKFEQLFMGSLVSAGALFSDGGLKEEDDEKSAFQKLKDNTPGAKEIRMMMTVSQKIDLIDLFNAFKKVALKSAYVDDGLRMKDSHFDKLSREDALGFMCEYASFFTFPSLLGEELEKKDGPKTSVT